MLGLGLGLGLGPGVGLGLGLGLGLGSGLGLGIGLGLGLGLGVGQRALTTSLVVGVEAPSAIAQQLSAAASWLGLGSRQRLDLGS